jgi:inorganic pyrophosphatase
MRTIIGKTVRGTIDRPVGSRHPRFPDTIYPVHYGYVDGVFAPDGAEQDVYVLGTDKPLAHFEGTVIAVYHRFHDAEDKWIVSLDGTDYTDAEILRKIRFQEQYFDGELIR